MFVCVHAFVCLGVSVADGADGPCLRPYIYIHTCIHTHTHTHVGISVASRADGSC